MADATLTQVAARYPEGTQVKAYAVTDWLNGVVNESAAPPGSAADTRTVTGGTLAFTGLTKGQKYVAHAQVGGRHVYTKFIAGADTSPFGVVRREEFEELKVDAVVSGEAAGGDLAGTYPNPTLRTPEAWREVGAVDQPAFQNSWANISADPAVAAKTAFMKDRAGRVHVKGWVVNGSAFNTVVFTLPVGYRPAEKRFFKNVAGGAAPATCTTTVEPDGDVLVVTSTGTLANGAALDGIAFKAEA